MIHVNLSCPKGLLRLFLAALFILHTLGLKDRPVQHCLKSYELLLHIKSEVYSEL